MKLTDTMRRWSWTVLFFGILLLLMHALFQTKTMDSAQLCSSENDVGSDTNNEKQDKIVQVEDEHIKVSQDKIVQVEEAEHECPRKLKKVNPPGLVTALATFPGSGNTWARHLIQQSTGKTIQA